jgi:hypothetical protein
MENVCNLFMNGSQDKGWKWMDYTRNDHMWLGVHMNLTLIFRAILKLDGRH